MANARLPANYHLCAFEHIPPLQYAILKNNKRSITYLINEKVNIVFEDQKGVLLLYEDQSISQLRLEILSFKSNEPYSEIEYFAGFKSESTGWILSKLPGLLEPVSRQPSIHLKILDKDSVKSKSETSAMALKTIVQCRCPKILDIAFEKEIIEPENDLSFSQFIARNGSEELTVHFLERYPGTLFQGNNDNPSMVESAVCNPNIKVLGALLNYLPSVIRQSLPGENSIPTQDQQISKCLYNSLRLSLDRPDTKQLEKLLSHKLKEGDIVKFNYFYGKKCNTLIQLVIIKQLKPIFLREILRKLQEITNKKYTHINCDIQNSLIPLADSLNKDRNTALHQVVLTEQEGLLDCLLEYNPSLLIRDTNDNTALHIAVINKHLSIVKKIVTKAGESNELLEARNSIGCTALHLAIDNLVSQNGELIFAIPTSLLDSNANFYATDGLGCTLLHHAIQLEVEHIRRKSISFILDYESNHLTGKIIHFNNNEDNYPLHFAVELLYPDVVELLLIRDPTVLLDLKQNDQTALHVVIMNFDNSSNKEKNKEIFDIILKAIKQQENFNQDDSWQDKRVICYQDMNGRTPLHLSVEFLNFYALTELLASSPCLDKADNVGNTILHQAVIRPHYLKYLEEILHSIQSRFSDQLHEYHYTKNLELLPPLQLAIKQNNLPGLEVLIREKIQLAFKYPLPNGLLTLCDGISSFSLKFLADTHTQVIANAGIAYYTGYEVNFNGGEYWVVSQLPKLNTTLIFEKPQCVELDEHSIEQTLRYILECRSQEPLIALFRKGFLQPTQWLSNGLFMSQFVSQHATEEVMEYYLTQHDETLFSFQEPGYKSMIESSICNPELNTIELLLKRLDNTHELPAVKACLHNSLEFSLNNEEVGALSLLLEYKSKLNDTYGHRNDSLLHLIIINDKHHTFISCLLGKVDTLDHQSTEIDSTPLIDAKNLDSKTALHLVIEKKNLINLIELLGYKPSLGVKDSFGDTALHYSVFIEDLEIVKKIVTAIKVENQTELLNLSNNGGCTSLHLAVYLGNLEIAKYLLDEGCDYLARDLSRQTMLHYAINPRLSDTSSPKFTPRDYDNLPENSNAIEIIKLLFDTEESKKIPDKFLLIQRCNEGTTPLHIAVAYCCYLNQFNQSNAYNIIELILEYTHKYENPEKSEIFVPESISYLDSYNRSILHHAVITNKTKVISRVLRELTTQNGYHLNRFGRLLLNLQDYDGKTALHIIIENKNYDAFKELMKYMPLLHLRDREKHWTVLHYIIDGDCSHGFLDDIIEAIGKGSFIFNIMDANGLSPLHLAIKCSHLWTVEQLVGSDAPLSIELGEIGCDTYTVGASVEKDYIMLGKTEKTEENITQIEEYIVAFKHGEKYLVSTLPELKDAKFLRDKDVEFTFSESLVRACLGSKCPELIAKLLNEEKKRFITFGISLMHCAAQCASKSVMIYLCEKIQPEFDYQSWDKDGNTLLHCAAMNKIENVKTLKYLLKMTENYQKDQKIAQKIVKLRNYKGKTALQISINDKKCSFFIALIKRGANIEQRNQDGNGILHILMEKQSKDEPKPYDTIKFLIDEIVKSKKLVHKLSNFLNIKNNKGLTALQIAIKSSYKDIVKLLIDNNASLSEIDPKSGNTIVHLATDNERNECNMELFNTVISAINRRDKDRQTHTILDRRNSELKTPLHISVRGKEKVFMTKSLLDAGVPLEIYDRDKNTALHIATENKDEETVKVIMQHLIKRGREYRLAERGWEYMRELVRENKKKQIPVCIPTSPSILKSMLQAWNHFYSVNFGEGRRGFLIHLAVFEQNTGLVKGIVDGMKEIEKHYENGSRDLVSNILSSRDNEDLTPLHIAAEKGNEQIAHILIRAGADIQLNSAKGTSFEVAMQKDHTELALYLVGEGANIDKYPNLLAYDKISNQYIQDEIFAKGKVNLKRRISSADCTIIHYAAKQSSVSRISFLLRNGIALTASDRDGKRVLHYAIQYRDNNYDVLKFFLDEATKRDELDKDPPNHLTFMEALMHRDLDGITPVMLAASLDRIDFFKLLITLNYEYLLETFDTRDPDENNVIHYLANNKSIKTAQLIVPHIQKTNIDLFTRIMNGRNVDGHSPIDLARKRGMQEMVDLFVDLCDLEYFEACPDVVHRMVRDRDFDNFSKVLEKAVITDSRNVQVATKLMDSNEEGDYPNFAFFNFNLAPLWHKLYRSNVAKFKYHPIVKFLIEEKLTIYRWWFMGLFFFYLFLFYVPFITALFLASSKCDSELFLYDTHADRFRFCLELYILVFTWLFMVNEVLEIEGKWRYIRNLSFTSFELNYRRQHQVLYYGDREPNRRRKFIQSTVKFLFYKLPILLHKRIFDFDRKHRFILRAIYQHLKETYSVIDMCSIVSLILLFFFRLILFFTESSTLSVLHWTISALTFSFFTFKFYKYTKIFPSLGIYIETLSNVLSTDVPRFSLVIVILLLSYVGSIQLVARTYCNYNGGQCSFSDWFGDPSVPFSSFTTPFISGLLFIIDGGPGNYEGSFRDVPLIFSLFYLVFAFCIIVVLLNVFIAQLSQTYSNIYSNKNLIDFKADLTLEYETQSNVLFKFDFPIRRPLKRIMVQSIIIPLETWNSYIHNYNKRINEGTETEKAEPTNDKELKPFIDQIESRILGNVKNLLVPILRNELDIQTKEILQQHTKTNSEI